VVVCARRGHEIGFGRKGHRGSERDVGSGSPAALGFSRKKMLLNFSAKNNVELCLTAFQQKFKT
jgi:hypothetical protein